MTVHSPVPPSANSETHLFVVRVPCVPVDFKVEASTRFTIVRCAGRDALSKIEDLLDHVHHVVGNGRGLRLPPLVGITDYSPDRSDGLSQLAGSLVDVVVGSAPLQAGRSVNISPHHPCG